MAGLNKAMLEELAADSPAIPAEAVTVKSVADALGLSVVQARLRLEKRVAAGAWTKAKRGVTLFYWKK